MPANVDMESDFAFSPVDRPKELKETDQDSDEDTDAGDDSFDEFMRLPRRTFGVYGSKIASE